MGIKISELTSATNLTGSEELPIVQAGNTKKATINQVNGCLNAIKVTLNSDSNFTKSSAWTWQIVPINNQEFLYGTGLSFNASNHSVVIGENVSLVRISLTCTISQGTPATTRRAVIGVTKSFTAPNTSIIDPAGNIAMVNGQGATYANSIVVPVSQGDEILLYVQTSDADTYRLIANRCCLTVEVLQKGSTTSTASLNTTRLMNTGALVGSGEKSNLLLEDFSGDGLTKTEDKSLEPLETKTLTNDETESGESI